MKDIKNYEGIYAVTEDGSVWSYKNKKFLKPGKTSDGYLQVSLSKDGKVKKHLVHRLVCTAFLPNEKNLPEINHIDKCPLNNCLSNLEWCDRQYNIDYSNARPIICVELNKTFISVREASRQLRIAPGNISSVLTGARKTASGYHWRYV